ncbi:MAG: hypothetical protein QXL30_01745 [Sulfolobales archaeon]
MSYVPSKVVSNEQVYGNYYILVVKTLRKLRKTPLPPQFSMVWVPGVDLIPLSYAYYENGLVKFFYKVVGEGTKSLSLRKPGDVIAISEPVGQSFIEIEKPAFLVGGSGIAPVLYYTKYLESFSGIWGVKHGELAEALITRFPKLKVLAVASEDCTFGFCGKLTDYLDKLNLNSNELVLVSGPTEMVKRVCSWLKGRSVRSGLVIAETLVKCGLGVCGSCVIGGLLLCRDGPVIGCEAF